MSITGHLCNIDEQLLRSLVETRPWEVLLPLKFFEVGGEAVVVIGQT